MELLRKLIEIIPAPDDWDEEEPWTTWLKKKISSGEGIRTYLEKGGLKIEIDLPYNRTSSGTTRLETSVRGVWGGHHCVKISAKVTSLFSW